MLKNVQFYSLPDEIGMTFVSSLPLDYIQIDVRNLMNTSVNYQKIDADGKGFEAGKEYTVKLDLEQMGGTKSLNTYPINVQEIRFVPNKAKATAGEQTINIKSLYAHYPKKSVAGDINADGEVNASDVTALINKVLNIASYPDTICDINADGTVNVSDVTALINLIIK